jgi:hypothetical protein
MFHLTNFPDPRRGASGVGMAQRDIQDALVHAAAAALRPFVRRLLAAGVPFGRVEARLRELFVEVAERELAQPGATPNDSRVSILTGINRKEVRRIRGRDREAAPRTFSRNLIASLISRWVGDPRTTDAAGHPLPLPYDARRGPSFVALARKTTVDLHPRALLDVLISAGAAVLGEGDVVALTRTAYVPQRGRSEALAMLADDPPELIETMLHNVLGEGAEPRLQQKLAYDNIGSDGLARLRAALRREANRLLERSNAVLLRHDRDRSPRAPSGERTYAGIGVYYFEAPQQRKPRPRSGAVPARKRIRRKRGKP